VELNGGEEEEEGEKKKFFFLSIVSVCVRIEGGLCVCVLRVPSVLNTPF